MAGLMDDALAADLGGPLLAAKPKRKGWRGLFAPKQIGHKTNAWDSPLMLLGGGALLLLIIAGGMLYWSLTSQSGEDLLRLADEDYRAGSYTQAINKYDSYLKNHSDQPAASLVRVRRGLCKLRQATATKGNWPATLDTAKVVLKEIGSESAIKQAHGDLAAMLPDIAEGLAEEARRKTDPTLLEQSREALLLVDKHVPKSSRPGERISDIEASLALTQRAIDRGKRLDEQVVAMRKAVADGNAPLAYDIRKRLLKEYPQLAEDEKLAEVLHEVSQAQLSSVEYVEQSTTAITVEPPRPFISTTALAQTKLTAQATTAEGYVVFAIAEGAAYGLDAASGRVLWRRFVGYQSDGRSLPFEPIKVSSGPRSDCILMVPRLNELWRVEGTTGKIRWRFPVAQRVDAQPLMSGGKLLVATRAGKLFTVDVETGESSGYVKLPQELRTAGVVDSRGRYLFQPADHSNLFVISLADGTCQQVLHLGHEQGTVTAPPVMIGGVLVVAINNGDKDSLLKMFAVKQSTEQGEEELSLAAKGEIRFRGQGHIDTPPQVSGRRMLITTDAGFISVLELAGIDAERPLVKFAETAVAGGQNILRFALFQGAEVWLADEQLTRYDIITARKRLDPGGVLQRGSTFEQPPQAIGRTIVTIRRKIGTRGTIVSALSMDQQKGYWETRLATAMLGPPLVDRDAGKIVAVTAAGSLFNLDSLAEGETIAGKPIFVMPPAVTEETFTNQLVLGGGKLAIDSGAGSKRIMVLSPNETPLSLSAEVPDELTCSPIAFGGRMLAPCRVGQVFLIDPTSAGRSVAPFQPRVSSGQKFQWQAAAVVDKSRAVLTDGGRMIYLLGLKDQPQPQLTALAEREAETPIIRPLATVGDIVYGVDDDGRLCTFKLPELLPGEKTALSGRVTWGPRRVGDAVLLATDDGRLLCLSGQEKPLWNVALNIEVLAGDPLAVGSSYILATADGIILRIDAQTGKQQAKIETNRPLATGPTPYGDNLLIGGHDGCIHQIKQP